LREYSHSVVCDGCALHVHWLRRPHAPVALLLHGTGASGHSMAALARGLAATHEVIVPDLPGHAFSQRPANAGLSLPGMARLLATLLQMLQARPALVVGHSAGAAIAARLCLDGGAAPRQVVSLSGAWFPPGGVAGWWYAPAARLLALNPWVPQFIAWQAGRPAALQRLLDSTGSKLDAADQRRYALLVGNAAHVGNVLAMMAAWDLPPLLRDLPLLKPHLHLVAAERDSTVPPAQARQLFDRLRGSLPHSRLHLLPGLGHLAHEEAPAHVLALIEQLVHNTD
jgi:magnesium chelatase accessory protein